MLIFPLLLPCSPPNACLKMLPKPTFVAETCVNIKIIIKNIKSVRDVLSDAVPEDRSLTLTSPPFRTKCFVSFIRRSRPFLSSCLHSRHNMSYSISHVSTTFRSALTSAKCSASMTSVNASIS